MVWFHYHLLALGTRWFQEDAGSQWHPCSLSLLARVLPGMLHVDLNTRRMSCGERETKRTPTISGFAAQKKPTRRLRRSFRNRTSSQPRVVGSLGVYPTTSVIQGNAPV